ncbi:MAG: ABC transporter ATP-binding protein [Clostridia bacterium]
MLKMIKRLLEFSGSEKSRIIKSFVFGAINSLFEVMPISAIIVVLSGIVEKNMSKYHMFISFGIMITSIIGQIVFGNISRNGGIYASYHMCTLKRLEIGERMKRTPMGYFSENRLGELTSTVTTTLADLENTAKDVFQMIINGFIFAIIINVWLLVFEWRLGIISIIGICFSLCVFSYLQKRSKVLSPKRQKAQIALVVSALEYIQGMGVVKAFSLGNKSKEAITNASNESANIHIKIEKVFSNIGSLYQSVFKFLSASILLGASYLLIGGEIDTKKAVMLAVSSFMLYKSIEIAGSVSALVRALEYSMDNVEEALNAPVIDVNGKNIVPSNFNIEFKNVSFAYDTTEVLKNINLVIPEKKTTALIGPSGSGKSTLCHLVSRFWDVTKGEVLLGGVNIKEYSYESLMQNISAVFQNVYLFEDSIKNNIKFGNPSATNEEIIEVCKKAQCHEFINSLPNGYDTIIGEGGSSLSGGEKQRISIARAMLKNAQVIVLDEATSSLDPENEKEVTKALSELTKDKTVIMIAHRLKTVEKADQIVVLNHGEISQRGTHTELINTEGIYKNFIDIRKQAIGWTL